MEEPQAPDSSSLELLRRPVVQDVGLALGAVGLLALLGGGALYIVVEPLAEWALRLIGAGAVLVLLSIVLAWQPLLAFARARQGRYGLNTGVMVVALGAILVIVNVVSARNPLRIDLTASQQFTLAPQTVQVLKGLQKPVKGYGFFTPSPTQAVASVAAANLLREYSVQSVNFSYDIIDPQARPSEAIRLGVTKDGTVVFETEDRLEQATEISERGFTTALLQVTGRDLKKVCFLTGHGERNLLDDSPEGYGDAKRGLEQDNFLVDTFNSATSDVATLQNCSVLVVAGPTQELTAPEQEMVAGYLAERGKALFLLDPNAPESFRVLLGPWGVRLGAGTIIDPQSRPEPTTPVVDQRLLTEVTGLTPITTALDTVFFPRATSVDVLVDENIPGPVAAYQIFLASNPLSWLELGAVEEAQFTAGEDQRGPIPLAAMIEGQPDPEGGKAARLAVIGDSDFGRNDFFLARNNSDLFLNTVNWLAEQEYLIAIRPKPSGYRVLLLTELQWRFILLSSLALLPLAVGAVGGVAWWLRR